MTALGIGKFYGSSLPRPRIYTDVKFNDVRIDPPVSVADPFMSWAEEAHWSMGGLRLHRHRLQGRIEGNVNKLRAERERFLKKRDQIRSSYAADHPIPRPAMKSSGKRGSPTPSPSPPPVPILTKRRRLMALRDEDEDEENESHRFEKVPEEPKIRVSVSRRFARKLGDDFDRVAVESGLVKSGVSTASISGGDGLQTVATRTRSRRLETLSRDAVEDVKKSSSEGNEKAKKSGKNGDSSPESETRTSQRMLRPRAH